MSTWVGVHRSVAAMGPHLWVGNQTSPELVSVGGALTLAKTPPCAKTSPCAGMPGVVLRVVSLLLASAAAHDRATLIVVPDDLDGNRSFSALVAVQTLWAPVHGSVNGSLGPVVPFDISLCDRVVSPPCCNGSVPLLVDLPSGGDANCSVRDAARALTARGAVAVIIELVELWTPASTEPLQRVAGSHAEFPHAHEAADGPPIVVLSENATRDVLAMLAEGKCDASLHADPHATAEQCECAFDAPALLVTLWLVWMSLLLMWIDNTSRRHAAAATPLHRLLGVVPALKVLLEGFTIGLWLSCPWQDAQSPWLFMGWLGLYTWHEASFLGLFLLLAKGWCITRPALPLSDVIHAATLLCLVYVTINTYLVLDSPSMWPPLLLVYGCVLASVLRDMRLTMHHLANQLEAMRASGIDTVHSPTQHKLRLFANLWWAVIGYAVAEGGIQLVMARSDGEDDEHEHCVEWVGSVARQVLGVALYAAVAWQLRARPRSPYFTRTPELVEMGRSPPPLYTAELTPVEPGPDGMMRDVIAAETVPPPSRLGRLGLVGLPVKRWRGLPPPPAPPPALPPPLLVRHPAPEEEGGERDCDADIAAGVIMVATPSRPPLPPPPPIPPPPPFPPPTSEEAEEAEEAEGEVMVEDGGEGEGEGEGAGEREGRSSPTARGGGGTTDWVGSNGLTPPSPLPPPSALPPPGGAAELGGSSRGCSPSATPADAERADERV